MHFYLLSLLPLLTPFAQAAPHKRQCTAKPHTNGTVLISNSQGQGQGQHNGSWGGHGHGHGHGNHSSHTIQITSSTTVIVPVPTASTSSLDGGANAGVGGDPKTKTQTANAQTTTNKPPPSPSSSKPPPPPVTSSKTTANPVPTGGGGGGGGGGGQVGLGWNSVPDLKSFTGLEWYYNWGTTPNPGAESLEFVPQIWGADNKPETIPASAKYVLSFNEPDMTKSVGGSDIAASEAATLHKAWQSKVGSGVQIGSPAVARGGKKWMTDWVSACGGGCKYDFVPFHFYGTNANDLIDYAKDFYATFGKPLWVTEFACKDYSTGQICSADETKAFMKTTIDYFRGEGKDQVHRWAWFGAFPDLASKGDATGLEETSGAANAVGKYYASL